MPTTRTPLRRNLRRRITPEAKQVFARAVALEPVYHSCEHSVNCRSTRIGKHCKECDEYLDLYVQLHRFLALHPGQTSPISAVVPDPPDYIARQPLKAANWRQAYALRLELQEG